MQPQKLLLLVLFPILLFVSSCWDGSYDYRCPDFNPEGFEFLPYEIGDRIGFRNLEDSVITIEVNRFSGEHVEFVRDNADDCHDQSCENKIFLEFGILETGDEFKMRLDAGGATNGPHWNLYLTTSLEIEKLTPEAEGTYYYTLGLGDVPQIQSLIDSLDLPFVDPFPFSGGVGGQGELYTGAIFEREVGLVLFRFFKDDIWVIDQPLDKKEFFIDNVDYNVYDKQCL